MQLWTAPRRVEIDPWAVTRLHDEPYYLNDMQRQAADEQAASRRWHAEAKHGTEGCADTGDEPADDFDFARGLLLAIAVTALLAALVVVLL